MSDKVTMLREMDEAFTDLRAVLRELDEASMLDWVTEEQASRIRRGVLGVRGTLIHIREHTVHNRDWRAARALQTAESIHTARNGWAPGSFWGLRYAGQRDRTRSAPHERERRGVYLVRAERSKQPRTRKERGE